MKASKTEMEENFINKKLIMYDDKTGSLWLEKTGKAIEGSMSGKALRELSASEYQTRIRWGDWKRMHPDTLLLICNHCYKK